MKNEGVPVDMIFTKGHALSLDIGLGRSRAPICQTRALFYPYLTQTAYHTQEILPERDFGDRQEITGNNHQVVVVGVNFLWFLLIYTMFLVLQVIKIGRNKVNRRKKPRGIQKNGLEEAWVSGNALKLHVFKQMMKKCHFFIIPSNFAGYSTSLKTLHTSYHGTPYFQVLKSFYFSSWGGSQLNFFDQYD